jgi:kynurenine formamidase
MEKNKVDNEFRSDRRQFAFAAGAATSALLISACGGGGSDGIGLISDATAETTGSAAIKWDLSNAKVIDLTHVHEASMPADPSLTTPKLTFFARVGQAVDAFWNLENITYTPHTGTHLDAPFHVNSSWGSFETMDPKLLIGPATVVSLTVPYGSYTITAADIKAWEAKNGLIQQGDAVLVHTGHDQYWPDKKAYIDDGYPIFSKDAAEYIVTKKARFVGMEAISPDGPNTDTHKIFMGGGVMVVENLKDLGKIGLTRCWTIGTFPCVKGGTGVYIRLLAVVNS